MYYLRSLSFLMLLFCFSFQSFSQIKLGVTGGANLSFLKVESVVLPPKALVRYNAGIKAPVQLNKFYISPELKYSVEGWSFVEFNNPKGRMNLHYLDLQLLAGYFLSEKISVEAGAEYGYLLKSRRDPYVRFLDGIYEKHHLGAILGVGYTLSEDLAINLRYIHGLSYLKEFDVTDMNGDTIGTDKSGLLRVLQLSFSYYFL